jgi:hypothetical protein
MAPSATQQQAQWSSRPSTSSAPQENVLGWGTVRSGLALTFFGILLWVVSVFVLVVLGFSYLKGLAAGEKIVVVPPDGLAAVVFVLALIGMTVSAVLIPTGMMMSAAAPSGTGAKGWGLATAVFLVALLVMTVVMGVAASDFVFRQWKPTPAPDLAKLDAPQTPPERAFSDREMQIIALTTVGVELLAGLSYLLFLRAVASYFRRGFLAFTAVLLLLACVGLPAGLVAMGMNKPQPLSEDDARFLFTIGLGGVAGLSLWFTLLVAQVRGAITRGLAGI